MAHVVATAFASKVFPVPGGPYSSRPERHRPSDSSSGCSRGNWIVSRISFFTSCSPPTSCQDTEGICQEGEPLSALLPEPWACLGSSCPSIQYPHFSSSELCNGENKLYKHIPKHAALAVCTSSPILHCTSYHLSAKIPQGNYLPGLPAALRGESPAADSLWGA